MPYSDNTIIGIIPQYPKHSQQNIYAKIRMPPIGIISVLSQIRGFNVHAIDENNYAGPRDFNGMPDHVFLQDREPAKIALFYGGMSNSIPRMFALARQYKKFGAITIAGGSHVDALPEEALDSGVDIVVHGEGEETIKEVLAAVFEDGKIIKSYKKNLNKIKGISYFDKKHIFTGKREPIGDLDAIEDPDLTLVKFLNKRWSAIPVSRGRGCNYNCEFCVVNKQYGKYKKCTVDKLLKQIIKYSDMGYKHFFVTDDNFAQDSDETIVLCRKIGDYRREFRKKISLTVQVRTEIAANDMLIEAMCYAGVRHLAIGFESPINQELIAMKKGVTVEKLLRRSKKLSEYFCIHGMFVFGYPTDSKSGLTLKKRAKQYKKFFRKACIDTVQVFNAVPLPGTALRARLAREKRLFSQEMVGWDKYDGLFLCYDPKQEGYDAYELQNLPQILMKKKYLGDFISSKLNYGNWLNWAYYATIGFPIQFSLFYTKRFVRNLVNKRRERCFMPKRNIFLETLVNTWSDIRRKWRNLVIRTYGGRIVNRWFREYKKSGYTARIKEFFA